MAANISPAVKIIQVNKQNTFRTVVSPSSSNMVKIVLSRNWAFAQLNDTKNVTKITLYSIISSEQHTWTDLIISKRNFFSKGDNSVTGKF